MGCVLMDFADALLMVKAGHPELAGWWGKLLGGGGDDGGGKPFDELTWDQVIASTKTGKYKTFTVGSMKELDLGPQGIVHMQIVGIDADDLAYRTGKASLSFISKELLKITHRMNPIRTPESPPYNEGTGSVGGWEMCEMRAYLQTVIMPLIPTNIRSSIKAVTKHSVSFDAAGVMIPDSETTDLLWLPSYREVFGGESHETAGCDYTAVFTDNGARAKVISGQSSGGTIDCRWWLRTASALNSTKNFRYVTENGDYSNHPSTDTHRIALGFCL